MKQLFLADGSINAELAADPFAVFSTWFDAAQSGPRKEHNACTLATANAKGMPSARVVLLKSFDSAGFVFYTNYESRKGTQLTENPYACLLFWWDELVRQVRIEGAVQTLSAAESDAYFASRPRGSQLGAWASPQSQAIDARADLEAAMNKLAEEYPGEVPRPPHWGGYRLVPERFEFWRGRENRLHDRVVLAKDDKQGWTSTRLGP